jgi:ABC-type transport system substrate-binding protein
MRDRTLRTIGASVVLAGLVVVGAVQLNSNANAETADIVAMDPGTEPTESRQTAAEAPASTTPEPFVYRVGVLSGISTDNFWAYYGEEPSVWNSYILGPTKPALYSIDQSNGSLVSELSAAEASPTWDAEGWRVRVPLDPDFRWSDGTPITAHDFVFTFNTVRAGSGRQLATPT